MITSISRTNAKASQWIFKSFIAAFALVVSACSGTSTDGTNKGAADDATEFVGMWTYQPGSVTTVTCPGQPANTTDLSKIPPNNQPVTFTLTETGSGGIHEDDGTCQFDWQVDGPAIHMAGESCSNYPDGRGGVTTTVATSATKSISEDGKMLTINIAGTRGPNGACTFTLTGTALKHE
jgi:hypothetical protein